MLIIFRGHMVIHRFQCIHIWVGCPGVSADMGSDSKMTQSCVIKNVITHEPFIQSSQLKVFWNQKNISHKIEV